jgi:hypothetical protein
MPITNYLPSSRLIQPGVCTSSTRPASPFEGQVIYETNTKQTLVWQGTAWVMLTDADTPPGLQLVKTQTVGSAVTSVTVNDAFSSEFDNYRITWSGGTQSASTDVYLQIGGSTTGYFGVLAYANTTATLTGATNNNNNRADWIGGADAGQAGHVSVDLMGPNLTAYTKIRNGSYQNTNNYGTYQGEHRVATSYTSFLLGVATGNITGGTIRVYGYRN